jgi:ligand-binding SRPBCC domain-containing protein
MSHTFHSEQWLPYPIELVFAFFANPENLPRLMPPWQKSRIEEAAFAAPPPRPVADDPALRLRSIAAGPGTRVTVSFRPFPYSPLRVPWEAEISEFVWNDHFCDLQIRGPFAFWRHCHSFLAESRPDSAGVPTHGTLLTDQIDYSLPCGLLGNFANQLIVARQIRAIFAYRQERTLDLLPRVFPTR